MGVHVNNKHANLRREDCRYTCGDLIMLALRDHQDIITGDWNQAGNYLEECCYHAVRTYESRNNMPHGTIAWLIPGTTCEIRTIFFNWPVKGKPYHMAVKEMTNFTKYSAEDFGLSSTDTDAHVPQFFMLRKWPADEPTDSRQFHPRSVEGAAKDKARQKAKKQRSRQMKAAAKAKAKAEAAAAEAAEAVAAAADLHATSSSEEEGMDIEATPEVAEEEAMDLEATAEVAESNPQDGEEEDSNTLELVDRSPGSSISSGLQDQFEAFQRGHGEGKGKGEQVTADSLHAAGFSSFISAGSASSSSPYSRAEERGPGLPSGPRNKGKVSAREKTKARGKTKAKI